MFLIKYMVMKNKFNIIKTEKIINLLTKSKWKKILQIRKEKRH